MNITLCVDALSPNPTGIGRYVWELLKGLQADPRITALHPHGRGRILIDPSRLLKGEEPRRRWRPLARLQGLRDRPHLQSSLVHGPNYFLPRWSETGIITVHDLSVIRYPETHPIERIRAFEAQLLPSIERALHIITDTQTVRREVIDHFALREKQVSAVHLGVEARFRPRPDEVLRPVLQRHGLEPGSYGLCVSTTEPRKKLGELIATWGRLPERTRAAFPLVLAGASGWKNSDIREAIDDAARKGWVKPLGFVPEEELPLIYAGARLFAYPSTYEGFGLPPLEAMASGVPVVVSERSCLPEVCGPAARYFDPDDDQQFLAAVAEGLEDSCWRSAAIAAGLDRAARFTWDSCVNRTIGVYQRYYRP